MFTPEAYDVSYANRPLKLLTGLIGVWQGLFRGTKGALVGGTSAGMMSSVACGSTRTRSSTSTAETTPLGAAAMSVSTSVAL
jgi:hypothetical protein